MITKIIFAFAIFSSIMTLLVTQNLHYTLLGLVGLVIYMIPALTANIRRHKDENAIAILNFFLGWTGLGWITALIWAWTGNVWLKPEGAPQMQNAAGE